MRSRALHLPESVRREAAAYHLHPALGDALLQLVAGAVPLEEDGSFSPFTYMPVAIRARSRRAKIEDFTQPLFIYAARTSDDSNPARNAWRRIFILTGKDGDVLVAFEGVQVQRLGRSGRERRRGRHQPLAVSTLRGGKQPLRAASERARRDRNLADLRRFARRCQTSWPTSSRSPAIRVCSLSMERNSKPCRALQKTVKRPNVSGSASIRCGRGTTGDCLMKLSRAGNRTVRALCICGRWIFRMKPPDWNRRKIAWLRKRAATRAGFVAITAARGSRSWLVTGGAQPVSVDGDAQIFSPIAVQQSPLVGFGRVAALEVARFAAAACGS